MLFFTNWKILLSFFAICIVVATIFYSSYLANKIAESERQKVEEWIEARHFITTANDDENILLASLIVAEQNNIPVIETNEKDSITDFNNIKIYSQEKKIQQLKSELKKFTKNKPIVTYFNIDSTKFNKYYYGDSSLLKELRYYPLIQLIIVALFILVTVIAINASNKNMQNQLWTGLAKETAHQLGTPVSALHGWIEMLRVENVNKEMIDEIEKDVIRLQLVSDRFSKIGSLPKTELRNVVDAIKDVVDYVKKRASQKINIEIFSEEISHHLIPLANPLFEWVIENILKNALDAIGEKGKITINIHEQKNSTIIDITDNGKGMSGLQIKKAFQPGFTTKKRGWGLGLTLCKRIIEDYHNGRLSVLNSAVGNGTTIRIVLPQN
jgi:signal transduction histidine kinase